MLKLRGQASVSAGPLLGTLPPPTATPMLRVLGGGVKARQGWWCCVGAGTGWAGIPYPPWSIPDAKSAYCGVEQLVPSVNLAF